MGVFDARCINAQHQIDSTTLKVKKSRALNETPSQSYRVSLIISIRDHSYYTQLYLLPDTSEHTPT